MSTSFQLFTQAKQYISGGVNSPVRSFSSVNGQPIFMKSGQGPYLISEEDKTYIDYIGSWGPLILGHAHPNVINAVKQAVDQGLGFGTNTKVEIDLAKKVIELMPNIELLRMVNSGTEATMSAIRLARAYTNRNKLLKFEGCYHGHSDSLLVKAGSGALTLGIPSSPGVPKDLVQHTVTADFNDLHSVERCFAAYPQDIACVMVEPMAGNMNFIPAKKAFLSGLRELCDHYGALLIFDEVMTGFRITSGGAQAYYAIQPDLTCLGKVIGGGLPVGAFGGRREIMQQLAPMGPVYQAGTLSGNPIAMTSGLATLIELSKHGFHRQLENTTSRLMKGLQDIAQQHAVPFTTNHVHSMFGLFFTDKPNIDSFSDVMQCDQQRFRQFFNAMLAAGVYLAPSMFECGFVSAAHDQQAIDKTLNAANDVMQKLATKGKK